MVQHQHRIHLPPKPRMDTSRQVHLICLLVFCLALLAAPDRSLSAVQSSDADDSAPKPAQSSLQQVVREAFAATHQGYSVDELLIRDDLDRMFVAECRRSLPDSTARDLNWALVNLRKAGKLNVPTTRRGEPADAGLEPLAEIAARTLQDRYEISTDEIFCDPDKRTEFDEIARQSDPEIEVNSLRKAALRLRKARQLRPELITRIADWGRKVTEYTAADLAADLTLVPAEPGIYIFRDKSGYLYIGEASDLRARLTTHLIESDRKSLASYLKANDYDSITIELHTFAADSRIGELSVRRAYESELIRSRRPRFNIRP